MSSVHRLGVAVWGVAAVLWLALVVLAARRERALRRRAGQLLAVERPDVRRGERWSGLRDRARAWLPVAGVASAAYALVGGVLGLAAGAVIGYGTWHWRRTHAPPRTPKAAGEEADGVRQLPLAADLLAACVTAGATPVAAARAVGESLRDPVGESLARGAAEVRLGSEPADAWRQLEAIPGAAPLAGLLERSGDSGAPAAEPVARLAADARSARARAATAKARRAAVLMTAPVGLCFLPAFVAVGVLPVLIGLAEGLLSTD